MTMDTSQGARDTRARGRPSGRRRRLGYLVLAVLLLAGLLVAVALDAPRGEPIAISEAVELIERGRVESAVLMPDVIEVVVSDGRHFGARRPAGSYHAQYADEFNPGLGDLLAAQRVPHTRAENPGRIRDLVLPWVVPFLVFLATVFVARRLQPNDADAGGDHVPEGEDQFVIVRALWDERTRGTFGTLETELAHILAIANIGRIEDTEYSDERGEMEITLRGPSADAIFEATRPTLESAPAMRGASVLIRYGSEDDAERASLVAL